MNNLERRFGKYAIRNLSLALILCYAFGYMIRMVNSGFLNYLTLDPWRIVHGQIWRVITWVIIPPDSSNLFFTLIMLFFYYSIGTALERTWGTWQYNVYIFSGILFTVAGSFVMLAVAYVLDGGMIAMAGEELYFRMAATAFSTYYINMSIFLAYAVTYPDMQVLFMFFIPLKVKYLGILYLVILGIDFIQANYVVKIAIAASLLNFALLWIRSRNWRRISPSEVKRRRDFRRSYEEGMRERSARGADGAAARMRPGSAQAIHRCAVCGRTELDDPSLEFRYCSKCEGNYEYCQDHLFTHVHVKKNPQ